MSLGSKYNRVKEFNKLLIDFKSLKTKRIQTIQKGANYETVDELYKNYYNAYKSDFDTNDELTEDKKKKFNYKQFELDDMINKESKLTELPEWLKSKNDFNEARKLINDIGADTNKVKSSSGDEKVFNDLNKLINDIQNKKIERKDAIKKKETLFLI